MRVVLLTGVNGSGKTELMKELLRKNGSGFWKSSSSFRMHCLQSGSELRIRKTAIVIGPYTERRVLSGADAYSGVRILGWLDQLELFHHDTVVLESQCLGRGHLLRGMLYLAKKYAWDFRYVWLRADLQTCKKRVMKRKYKNKFNPHMLWRRENEISSAFEALPKNVRRRCLCNNSDDNFRQSLVKLQRIIFK